MYTDEQILKLESEEFLSSNPKLYEYIYNKGRADGKAEHKYLIKADGNIRNLDEDIEKARADAFNEFVESYRAFCELPSGEGCQETDDECDGMCIDCFAEWIKEQRHK